MDKLPFRNKTKDYATMGKKGNMIYWDAIDNLAENYVRQLIELSTQRVSIYEDDDIIMDLGKRIADFATNLLTEEISAEFPYVNEIPEREI